MKSLLLPTLLLCALCVGVTETQEGVKALRLCGRELLRAVVYTCGGSRWRRLLVDEDTPNGTVDHNGLRTWRESSMAWRRRRDLSKALITMCCQHGCQKNDLSALC